MSRLLTIPEVADRLRVSPPMVYKLIAEGKLPVVRIGTLLRIDSDDLEAYILANKTKATCRQVMRPSGKSTPSLSLHKAGDAN